MGVQPWAAVVDLNDDPEAEIIVVASQTTQNPLNPAMFQHTMWTLNHDGTIHSGPFGLFQDVSNQVAHDLGPPTVADFDGDGELEVAIATYRRRSPGTATLADPTRTIMSVYRLDGSILWQRDLVAQAQVIFAPGASAFDFDGNGSSELVFLDPQKLYIFNGSDGTSLFELGVDRVNDGVPVRHPTVADVDNDGSAEILVPTRAFPGRQAGSRFRNGVLALADAKGNWVDSRRIWNQWEYHVTNVNEDATIPVQESPSFQANNSTREQIGPKDLAAPDLSVSTIGLDDGPCPAGATRVTVRVGNGGPCRVGPNVPVRLYGADPSTNPPLLASTITTQGLYPGEFEDIGFDCVSPPPDPVLSRSTWLRMAIPSSGSFHPDGDPITVAWNQTGGVNVTLSDPNVLQPTFTSPFVPTQGSLSDITLTFELTATGGGLSETDIVEIKVEDNLGDAPIADAGPDQFHQPGTPVVLDGTNSFDPNSDPITFAWALISAPAGSTAALDDPTSSTPGFTADLAGIYEVDLVVNDGLRDSIPDRVVVTATNDNLPPTVSITASPLVVDLNLDVTLTVVANDDQGIGSLDVSVSGTPVPLDASGVGVYSSPTAGDFVAEVIATDVGGNQATASADFTVAAEPPFVQITSPPPGNRVTSPTQIRGTVTDGNLDFYTLSYALFGTTDFTEFARGTAPVVTGQLGTFDPTLLQNDTYTIRLEAVDTSGNRTAVQQEIDVLGNLKLGNFRLEFTDLSIPVSGIPITIRRIYDTLTANLQGDFGFGWRLEIADTELRTSVPKTGLENDLVFNPFMAGTGSTGTGGTRVYITVAGGQREGFTFRPRLASSSVKRRLRIFEPEFIPDPGVRSKLTVPHFDLLVSTGSSVFDRNDNLGGQVYVFGFNVPYNPSNPVTGGIYNFATEDGIAYEINGLTGKAKRIADANQNALIIDDDGIRSVTDDFVTTTVFV